MFVVVFGGGAVGGTTSAYLMRAGHQVALVDAWPEHVEAIREDGLVLTEGEQDSTFRPRAIHWSSASEQLSRVRCDLVVVAVKLDATDAVMDLLGSMNSEFPTLITMQNGLAEEDFARVLGDRVLGEVTEFGAGVCGPGHIAVTPGGGGVVLGELSGATTERLTRTAEAIGVCMPVATTDNIIGHLWSKLVWNSVINSCCAIAGQGIGAVLKNQEMLAVVERMAIECVAVATRLGIRLEPLTKLGVHPARLGSVDDAARRQQLADVASFYRSQLDRTPSMLRDVRTGRKTEVDYLNGVLVQKGLQLGVPTPENARAVTLIHRIETGDAEPSRDLLVSS